MNNLLDSLRLTPKNTSRPRENPHSSFSFTSNQTKPHRRSVTNSLGLSQIRTNLKKLKDTSKASFFPELSPRHKESFSNDIRKSLKITVNMPKVELQGMSSKEKIIPITYTNQDQPIDVSIQTRESPSPRSLYKKSENTTGNNLRVSTRPLTP